MHSFLLSTCKFDCDRIMQMAMDKAVTEIVSPVIQRSVTIASRTTKELVLKVNFPLPTLIFNCI